MKSLIIASSVDRAGLRDASRVFLPEAAQLARPWATAREMSWFVDCVAFERKSMSAWRLRRYLADRLAGLADDIGPTVSLVAFLCHGWSTGIQFGFHLAHIERLAKLLARLAVRDGLFRVVLYCCKNADGPEDGPEEIGPATDGGFADLLRDQLSLCGIEAQVDAHKTSGHATQNPHVVRFDPGCGIGGSWLVKPQSLLWSRWCARLHAEHDMLRYRYPLMSRAEIAGALTD